MRQQRTNITHILARQLLAQNSAAILSVPLLPEQQRQAPYIHSPINK